jgi:dihydrofolate reductase
VRRVVSGTLMSVNGVIGNPHEWASEYFDDEAAADSLAQLRRSAAMLMGRKTYEIFSRLWPASSGDYADAVNNIPKYVFSSTLTSADWTNSTVVRDEPAAFVKQLKAECDGDLVLYGHGPLGRTLLEHGLIDELKVFVNPRFVGAGTLMFSAGESTPLAHVATETRSTGAVVITYRPEGVS